MVAVVPFHSYVAIARDWLSTYGRTAKIGFYPYCYGTAVMAQWKVVTAQRNFYGAYVTLKEHT